jgi:hypothetical protein
MHEVDIEVIEACCACVLDGRPGLVASVNPAQRLQAVIVEALYSKGQAVDPGCPEILEFACL